MGQIIIAGLSAAQGDIAATQFYGYPDTGYLLPAGVTMSYAGSENFARGQLGVQLSSGILSTELTPHWSSPFALFFQNFGWQNGPYSAVPSPSPSVFLGQFKYNNNTGSPVTINATGLVDNSGTAGYVNGAYAAMVSVGEYYDPTHPFTPFVPGTGTPGNGTACTVGLLPNSGGSVVDIGSPSGSFTGQYNYDLFFFDSIALLGQRGAFNVQAVVEALSYFSMVMIRIR